MTLGLALGRARKVRFEPIEMRRRRYGYIPEVFFWHGHSYRVHAVERCWTDIAKAYREGRLCFRVRCAEGRFELFQDVFSNTWHVRNLPV